METKEEAPMFYIYDWPTSVTNSFPDAFISGKSKVQHITADFKQNYGLGEVIDINAGLYHTHQYSLFSTVLARLEENAHRTLDPEKASLFFIPYDVGMDATARRSDGVMVQTSCPRSSEATSLLQNSKYFLKHSGRDHFMINSINQMMLFFLNEPCREVFKVCQECIKLGIDKYGVEHYRELRKLPEMHERWHSIPFPSNTHYNLRSHPHNYDNRALGAPITDNDRWYDIVYMGSDWVTAQRNKRLRGTLRRQCMRVTDPVFTSNLDVNVGMKAAKKDRSSCYLVTLESHASNTKSIFADSHHHIPISTSAAAAAAAAAATAATAAKIEKVRRSPYAHGRLCLMPGGDFPTRKATLDALLSGCVPVTFEKTSAQGQWLWHWGSEQAAEQATHYISREVFMDNPQSEFQKLVALARNTTFMKEKRHAIEQVRSRMQYHVPYGYPKGYDAPVDAVDVILEHILLNGGMQD